MAALMATPPAEPRLAVAMSEWSWRNVFGLEDRARLAACCKLLNPDRPLTSFDGDAADAIIRDAHVLVTGWGAPHLAANVLGAAPLLQLVAHAAGTVKGVLAPEVWQRGIIVTNAAQENARPVAEYTVAMVVLANKNALLARDAYRQHRHLGPFPEPMPVPGNRSKVVGVIGASRVGRIVLELLRAYELETWVSDPLLDEGGATVLGARLVELDDLMAGADVVSLHAPLLPTTVKMIDARRLSLLKAGAVLVNTARGAIIDPDALTAELRSGRISAVIDTTDPEPLPPDHPLFDLPNAFVTPHLAGSVGTEMARLAGAAVHEVERFCRGHPPLRQVTASDLEVMA